MANLQGVFELYLHQRLPELISIESDPSLEPCLSALLNPTDAIAALTDEQFVECQRVAEQLKVAAQAFQQELKSSVQDESLGPEPDSERDAASRECDVIRRISESGALLPSYLANLLNVCLNRRTLTAALDHISTHMDGWSRIALSFELAAFLLAAIPDSVGLIKEVCCDYVTRNYLQWIQSVGGWQSFLRN